MVDLLVSIVTMDNKEYIRNCLNSIHKTFPEKIEVKVAVVDNNSPDDVSLMIKEDFPWAHLITLKNRLGFAESHNLIFSKYSDARYFLILNDDTEVMAGSIEHMVEHMDKDKSIGCMGCRILSPEYIPQASFGVYPSLLSLLYEFCTMTKIFPNAHIFSGYTGNGIDYDTSRELDKNAIWGCCFMVSREAVEKVGFLDITYTPAYLEETDWCTRINEAGFKIYYLATAQVMHHHGTTMNKIDEDLRNLVTISLQKNRYYYFRNHIGLWQEVMVRIYDFFKSTVFVIFFFFLFLSGKDKNYYKKNFFFSYKLIKACFTSVPVQGPKTLTLENCKSYAGDYLYAEAIPRLERK